MSYTNLAGDPTEVTGTLPAVGSQAQPFSPVGKDLKDLSRADFAGRRGVLNIVPSLDTPVCATSTRKFNASAGKLADSVVRAVSADLPFAMERSCTVEGLHNVVPLSTMRGREFMRGHGVEIASGPLAAVTARAVLVLDEGGLARMYHQVAPAHREFHSETGIERVS